MDRRSFLTGSAAAAAAAPLVGGAATAADEKPATKFEPPVIKFTVMADGPACFDIADEKAVGGGGPDPLGRKAGCDCLCECICESPCKCICECPCECPCPCMAPSKALAPDRLRKGSALTVVFGDQFMIRRESFGGVLFNKTTFSWYVCNRAAFEILRFIENRRRLAVGDLAPLMSHLRETFRAVPDDVESMLRLFIAGCVKHGFLETA